MAHELVHTAAPLRSRRFGNAHTTSGPSSVRANPLAAGCETFGRLDHQANPARGLATKLNSYAGASQSRYHAPRRLRNLIALPLQKGALASRPHCFRSTITSRPTRSMAYWPRSSPWGSDVIEQISLSATSGTHPLDVTFITTRTSRTHESLKKPPKHAIGPGLPSSLSVTAAKSL